VHIAVMVPLESHFSRQYAPFCLMDTNLLETNNNRLEINAQEEKNEEVRST